MTIQFALVSVATKSIRLLIAEDPPTTLLLHCINAFGRPLFFHIFSERRSLKHDISAVQNLTRMVPQERRSMMRASIWLDEVLGRETGIGQARLSIRFRVPPVIWTLTGILRKVRLQK